MASTGAVSCSRSVSSLGFEPFFTAAERVSSVIAATESDLPLSTLARAASAPDSSAVQSS